MSSLHQLQVYCLSPAVAHLTWSVAIDATDRNGRSPSPWLRVDREKAAQMIKDLPRLNDPGGGGGGRRS